MTKYVKFSHHIGEAVIKRFYELYDKSMHTCTVTVLENNINRARILVEHHDEGQLDKASDYVYSTINRLDDAEDKRQRKLTEDKRLRKLKYKTNE